jgi:hypothetical protein
MTGGSTAVVVAAAAVAEAEAFASRLERVAASLPKIHVLHCSLDPGHLRAASAFEAIVAGPDADAKAPRTGAEGGGGVDDAASSAVAGPARTTWYSAGKRHLHQPQLEALARVIAPLAGGGGSVRLDSGGGGGDGVDGGPGGDGASLSGERLRGATQLNSRGVGGGRCTLLELGAGQALLGRVVSRLSGAPLVAVDRRVARGADGGGGDARGAENSARERGRSGEGEAWDHQARGAVADRDEDEGDEEDEEDACATPASGAAPDATATALTEEEEEETGAVTVAAAPGGDVMRRLVADLTRCTYDELVAAAGVGAGLPDGDDSENDGQGAGAKP